MEVYLIHSWTRQNKKLIAIKVMSTGNKNLTKVLRVAKRIALQELSNFPHQADYNRKQILTPHLAVTRIFDKDSLLTVGCISKEGQSGYYGALIDRKSKMIKKPIIKQLEVGNLGHSVHNVVCLKPFFLFMMSDGKLYFGQVTQEGSTYQQIKDFSSVYMSSYCSLSISRYLHSDGSAFYAIVKDLRDPTRENNNLGILKIEVEKNEPRFSFVELSEPRLNDLCTNKNYIFTCTDSILYKVDKKSLGILSKTVLTRKPITCMVANDKHLYLSVDQGEQVLSVDSLSEVAKCESGLLKDRRLMDLFIFGGVQFLMVLDDKNQTVAFFVHCGKKISLVYKFRFDQVTSQRIFHMLNLPKENEMVFSNECDHGRVYKITKKFSQQNTFSF